ncbi:MAG: diguanylate cyclase [Kordiimonadaceae bacterium]|jgi:diguanylate cyclase (GGDEF)-like protein/PAS domain S-box-containing protein|nr:diguanylate cyclase [Kordiimonadaceae bacterium]MBT6033472.1 diguanylate cyclase [Kordiimonadaceae bacterium]
MESNITRILKQAKVSLTETVLSDTINSFITPEQIITNYNGPALLVDNTLNITQQNIYADNLVTAISNENQNVISIIIRCINNNCPDNQKFTLEDETGTRHYDLFAFPVKSDDTNGNISVLLFGNDTTVEHHLTKALVNSRQMFKDLVSCSTDFAWETDDNGRFKYVSPNGILGYTAYELNDKRAANLIVGDDGINPFDTLDTINDVEIWLQRSDGSFACVQVSASPIIDNNSRWQGARGVCRDITIMREREAALRRIQNNEQILKKIISTIRDEIDPSKILHSTAFAAIEGIAAQHCYIIGMKNNADGKLMAELKAESGMISDRDILDKLSKKAIDACNTAKNKLPPSFVEETIGEYSVLIGFSRHHDKLNGALFILNKKDDKEWNTDEKSLFTGITSHLGIAFEQIKNYEKLEKLSCMDELTSLANRRSFSDQIKKRLIIQKRQKHTCALLYIDLDNFKQANDVYGHAKGDEILKTFANILTLNTREEDICCRLGGDEFAVWLEDVNEVTASKKAENIIKCNDELRKLAKNLEKPLSLSVGIALCSPDTDHTLDALLDHADKALYEVKKNGKSGVSLS